MAYDQLFFGRCQRHGQSLAARLRMIDIVLGLSHAYLAKYLARWLKGRFWPGPARCEGALSPPIAVLAVRCSKARQREPGHPTDVVPFIVTRYDN
jgi:hypothetical protein